MPFQSKRAKLNLSADEIAKLTIISKSRTESLSKIQRAKMILWYSQDQSISTIARELGTNRAKVERHISKALELGVEAALEDLPRSGKPNIITPEAKKWVISLACQKPKDLGYSYEIWTTDLLSKHVQKHCVEQGYPCLGKLARGTVSKILAQSEIKPHKIQYYLERRDPEFDYKMAQVLYLYKEIQLVSQKNEEILSAYISYDEKPGIQAIENTVADLPPIPGRYHSIGRDYEYIRHGTVSLLAGMDLITGEIIAKVEDKHRSREFVEFLKQLDAHYKDKERIVMILDNHSAHTSKETRAYLATVPNRFEFVFTPKHGSWLNLVESFFSKMTRQVLRGIRVKSKEELGNRLLQYIDEVNKMPIVYRWKYKLDSFSLID